MFVDSIGGALFLKAATPLNTPFLFRLSPWGLVGGSKQLNVAFYLNWVTDHYTATQAPLRGEWHPARSFSVERNDVQARSANVLCVADRRAKLPPDPLRGPPSGALALAGQ